MENWQTGIQSEHESDEVVTWSTVITPEDPAASVVSDEENEPLPEEERERVMSEFTALTLEGT